MNAEQRAALHDSAIALRDAADSISGEFGAGLDLAGILADPDEHGHRQAAAAERLSAAFDEHALQGGEPTIQVPVSFIAYAAKIADEQGLGTLGSGCRALLDAPSMGGV